MEALRREDCGRLAAGKSVLETGSTVGVRARACVHTYIPMYIQTACIPAYASTYARACVCTYTYVIYICMHIQQFYGCLSTYSLLHLSIYRSNQLVIESPIHVSIRIHEPIYISIYLFDSICQLFIFMVRCVLARRFAWLLGCLPVYVCQTLKAPKTQNPKASRHALHTFCDHCLGKQLLACQ